MVETNFVVRKETIAIIRHICRFVRQPCPFDRRINIAKQPPEVFYKKGALKNFTKFTGKHLCQSLVFNKVAGLRPEQNTSGRLLLNISFKPLELRNYHVK